MTDRTSIFKVTRVVGPGVGAEWDPNQFIAPSNLAVYILNGVVGKYADLQISASVALPKSFYAFLFPLGGDSSSVATAQVKLHFTINGGTPVGDDYVLTASITKAQFDDPNIDPNLVVLAPLRRCVKVSTEYLKFARKAPSLGGGPCPFPYDPGADATCPAINSIGVRYQVRWSQGISVPANIAFLPFASSPTVIRNTVTVSGSATRLSFAAMAPIVLVHGWNAGPWVWGPKPANSVSPPICPVNPRNASDGGQNFVQRLQDAKVPFDCSILIDRQALLALGAQTLESRLAGVLSQFGTRHVNLVAHSKGGLFAREFLKWNAAQDAISRIGVISLTTLDTPHHGSVLSDIVVATDKGADILPLGLGNQPIYFFLSKATFFRDGGKDVTVDNLEKVFNPQHDPPPPSFILQNSNGDSSATKPFYYSVSADADTDGNGKINGNEGEGYSYGPAGLLTILVMNWRYQTLGHLQQVQTATDSAGRLVTTTHSTSVLQPNDTGLTVESARYPRFDEIQEYMGGGGRNHATVRKPDVAGLVLLMIDAAQSQQ